MAEVQESFALVSDLVVAAGNETPYESLIQFLSKNRPNAPRPTRRQAAKILKSVGDYVSTYESSAAQTRYPLSHITTTAHGFFVLSFNSVRKETKPHLIVTLHGLSVAWAYSVDVLKKSVDIEHASDVLSNYTTPKAVYLRYIEMYMPPISDRADEKEIETTEVFEIRGLSPKFYLFEEDIAENDTDLPMEVHECLIQSIFHKYSFAITYGRLEPCRMMEVKYLFLITKQSMNSNARFIQFQQACHHVENDLARKGLLLSQVGGIYGRDTNKKIVDFVPIEHNPIPKPTPRRVRSGSRRQRIANMINPMFKHDEQGDSEIKDSSRDQSVPMNTDAKCLIISVPFACDFTQRDLAHFRRRFSSHFKVKRVSCGVISIDRNQDRASIRFDPNTNLGIPMDMASAFREVIIDGVHYDAEVTENNDDFLTLKSNGTRKRRFSDVSMYLAGVPVEPDEDNGRVKRIRLGSNVDIE